jgi:DNA-binding GntR family transcriptional regulator
MKMPKQKAAIDAYEAIKNIILAGQFKPGNKLSDLELATELGVSRTPVRNALSRLARDGLLDAGKGKGYYIPDLGVQQIDDLYALREVFEAHAVRLAVERATPSHFAEFKELLAILEDLSKDPSKRGEEIRIGLKVHEIIARASGDAFLHETVIRLLNRMYFFIWMETLNEDPEAADLTRREHSDLLEFIQSGKSDEAEALVRSHIRTARESMLKILAARDAFYQPSKTLAERHSDVASVSMRKRRCPRPKKPGSILLPHAVQEAPSRRGRDQT